MSALMRPLDLGALRIPNRVIMSPLTRARAGETRIPNDLMVEYYAQRSGAGLIISEATSISPQGVGYHGTPGIWSEAQILGWQKVTQAVHDAGGRIFLQLWHVGRISDPELLDGHLPVAPSPTSPTGRVSRLRPKRPYVTPRALETQEIPNLINDFRRGAQNAKDAGFDGVEIHAGNGYLIDQFLQDSTNHRTDQYGGTIGNRARLLMEITEAVTQVWGPGRVGVHLSPQGKEHDIADSNPTSLFTHIAKELNHHQIAFLFVREIQTDNNLLHKIGSAFQGPVIANDSLSVEDGSRLVESGTADAIAFGRDYIATPDLAERIAVNSPLNAPNPPTFYPDAHANPAVGYTDYPAYSTI